MHGSCTCICRHNSRRVRQLNLAGVTNSDHKETNGQQKITKTPLFISQYPAQASGCIF